MKPSALFPEVLRVGAPGAHLYTTSHKVAGYFDLPHKDVLCRLRNLSADIAGTEITSDTAPWFWPSNHCRSEYHMSEKGFALLVMHQYLTTFLQMQSCLKGETP